MICYSVLTGCIVQHCGAVLCKRRYNCCSACLLNNNYDARLCYRRCATRRESDSALATRWTQESVAAPGVASTSTTCGRTRATALFTVLLEHSFVMYAVYEPSRYDVCMADVYTVVYAPSRCDDVCTLDFVRLSFVMM